MEEQLKIQSGRIDALTAEVEALAAKQKESEAHIGALTAEVGALSQVVNDLMAKQGQPATSASSVTFERSAEKPPAVSGETFKVGKKEYRAKYPRFTYEGREITEAQLLSDKKLQAEIVEAGLGVIEEVD